jgi:hypothetical protein
MAFEKGNEIWRMADPFKVGRPRLFKTPEDLWNAASEYFEYIDLNPIVKKTTSVGEKGVFVHENEYNRPYTWEGLYLFLGVESLDGYKTKQEFSGILTRIRHAIYSQKFEGAAAGVFNANIIARDLGLSEKKEVDQKVKVEDPEAIKKAFLESLKINDPAE